jgi:hypothetical protein
MDVPLGADVSRPLLDALAQPYNELFDQAPGLSFTPAQIQQMREYLKTSQRSCTTRFDREAKSLQKDIEQAQAELSRREHSLKDAERKQLHCRIQNGRIRKAHAELLAKTAIPIAYQNREAKLDVITKWPAELRLIEESIRGETYRSRPFGNVADIGFREVGRGQEDDIKAGQKALDEIRRSGMMPKELDNPQVQEYVRELAGRIAFALPGGLLFIQRGLLDAVEDEAQLAGVIAHEISHSAARHGHKLMRRAMFSALLYEAAQVVAIIFTGGAASIGAYYALQYGFYGLGLMLNLNLLGVSREYEIEADQLGVQYAWNAGYDPTGFIRFFDTLANREGYARGVSWFRTHPPFFERMLHTRREILFLAQKEQLIRQTSRFEQMKERLARKPGDKEAERTRPSLLLPESDCPKPELAEYKPGQRVEDICAGPIS